MSQMSLQRLLLSQMSLRRLLISQMSLRSTSLQRRAHCCEGELVNAALSCGVHWRRSAPLRMTLDDAEPVPRRVLGNAELILRSTFLHSRGSWPRGSTFLHRWAQSSDSRGYGSSQARRQERDTMMHQSVRTEVLNLAGNPAPFIFFRLRLYQGTSCADGSENQCLVGRRRSDLNNVEIVFRDFVAYGLKF